MDSVFVRVMQSVSHVCRALIFRMVISCLAVARIMGAVRVCVGAITCGSYCFSQKLSIKLLWRFYTECAECVECFNLCCVSTATWPTWHNGPCQWHNGCAQPLAQSKFHSFKLDSFIVSNQPGSFDQHHSDPSFFA